MKEQFIILSSNYRRPVSSIFKEKIEGTLGAAQNKAHHTKLDYQIMLPARETVAKLENFS